jgi:hypothetical protein
MMGVAEDTGSSQSTCKNSRVVTLSEQNSTASCADRTEHHPLASPTVIRTVKTVRHHGATLGRESGPGAHSPVPRGRISKPHPESGQGRRPLVRSLRGPPSHAIVRSPVAAR